MKNPRSLVVAGAALAVSLLALSGCAAAGNAGANSSGTVGAGKSKGEIAFFSPSSQIDVISALGDGVSKYFESQGYTVVVQDAGLDSVKQAQQIKQAIDTHSIVGAWIMPVAPETAAQSVAALQAAKIPVVVEGPPQAFGFDGPQPGIAFDAPDFQKYGTMIGDTAATCAVAEGGREALFLTPPDAAGGSEIVIGALKGSFTAGAPDVPIVATGEAADIASAQTMVSQLLVANPDANVVIAASDETALGAVGAFKAANKTSVCIVAGGGGDAAMATQQAGDITAVISWDYTSAIDKAGTDLIRMISDPTSLGGVIETPVKATGGK